MSARPVGTWLLIGAGVAVLLSLIAAVAVTGSPAQQRLKRLDERRVRDLIALEASIEGHHRVEGRLPASLDELARSRAWGAQSIRDPETGRPYEYRAIDARRYELCARFATASQPPQRWERAHPAGRHCVRNAVGAAPATVE